MQKLSPFLTSPTLPTASRTPIVVDPRIEVALSLLRENLLAPPSVKEVATKLNITSSYLRHLFKKDVGVSLSHHLKLLRLREAKNLLLNTFLSVKEVMAAVGFSDFSHFVRDYKIHSGETPSQTRASALGSRGPDVLANLANE